MNFNNLIIYSDVDGTASKAIGRNISISKNNIEAINDFIVHGGHFGIASGRNHDSILKTFIGAEFNMPLVESNGAAAYDINKHKYIFTSYINDDAKAYVYNFVLKNKRLMLTALDDFDTHKVIMNDERDKLVLDYERSLISYDDFLNRNILKCAILALKEDIDSIIDDIEKEIGQYHLKSGRSAPIYLELYDYLAGKQEGIKRVIDNSIYKDKVLVCIGDYYNDIEMLKMADIAICPNNAIKEVKDICDYIAGDCDHDTLKDAIDYLRSR